MRSASRSLGPAAQSSDQTRFGVPKAFINRRRKGAESPIEDVEGDDWLKATLCGPCAAASRRIAAAVVSRASSQEISTHPDPRRPSVGSDARVG